VNSWVELRLAAATFLDHHGLLAAVVAVLIEEAGIPMPLPGDLLMLAAGIRARHGLLPLWQVIAALEAATVVGATLLYAVSRWAGRGLLLRYGRFIHVNPSKLDRAEQYLRRHGFLAVTVARLIPSLRIVSVIACGVLGVPPRIFVPGMALGALLYILIYTLLGYFVGARVLRVLERVEVPLDLLGSVVAFAAVVFWIVRARRTLRARAAETDGKPVAFDRRYRLRAGLTAGAVATLASTLLMNLIAAVGPGRAVLAPGTLIAFTVSRLAFFLGGRGGPAGPLLLLLAVPLFVAVGVAWGGVYALWAERQLRLPDWAKGLVFALLPLAVALVALLPLLGLGVPGRGVGPLATVSEVVRHLSYGLALGVVYPVFLVRRRARARPPQPTAALAAATGPPLPTP
jgi:membrane protein DedA with SNARE-associated domain